MRILDGNKPKHQLAQNKFGLFFPNKKQGEFTPKPILIPKTYSKYSYASINELLSYNKCMCPADYVDDLIQKTLEYCKNEGDNDRPLLPTALPPLLSAYVHPDKDHVLLFSHYKK